MAPFQGIPASARAAEPSCRYNDHEDNVATGEGTDKMSAMDFYRKDLQRIAGDLAAEANCGRFPNWQNVAAKIESLTILVRAATRIPGDPQVKKQVDPE